MTYENIIILIILMTLEELKSQNDYFEHFKEDIKTDIYIEDFTTKFKGNNIAKITNYLKSVQLGREITLKNPDSYCHSFDTCHECVKSLRHMCSWCHDVGCTNNPEELCPYTKKNTNAIDSCPFINHKVPIFIHAGVRRHIKVELTAPDAALYYADMICQLKFKNRLTHLKAMVHNDFVYCYPFILKTEEYPDTETGVFNLIWGGAQPFSNEIPLTVYRCEVLALDCAGCRMLPPEYGCGWCDDRDTCVIAEKCADNLIKWTVTRLKCDIHGKKLYYV